MSVNESRRDHASRCIDARRTPRFGQLTNRSDSVSVYCDIGDKSLRAAAVDDGSACNQSIEAYVVRIHELLIVAASRSRCVFSQSITSPALLSGGNTG
jgi:hypothetical protein